MSGSYRDRWMSSRSLGAALLVLFLGALGTAAALAGCSDDESLKAPSDSGREGAIPDANRPAPEEPDAEEPKSCRERCEEAHPTALAKDEAIDSCWETNCGGPCIQELPPDGGIAADGAAPDGGTCISPVLTISLACDECTNMFCCASWDGCFQDPECTALNACYQQCN
jgi:hypothetical protein